MSRDEDGLAGERYEIGLDRPDLAIDAAAGGVVDEGLDSVPPGIADMDDIGVGEVDRDVAVGVGGRIVFENDSSVV